MRGEALTARLIQERERIEGVAGTLADAAAFVPALPPTLIVTNPPMGRRVQRGSHGELLDRFLTHAAAVLAPGGALVGAVPDPEGPGRSASASQTKKAYSQP